MADEILLYKGVTYTGLLAQSIRLNIELLFMFRKNFKSSEEIPLAHRKRQLKILDKLQADLDRNIAIVFKK